MREKKAYNNIKDSWLFILNAEYILLSSEK